MLIRGEPDVYHKLQRLGGMATDDILAPPSQVDSAAPRPDWSAVGGREGRTQNAAIYRAAMPGGKRISLLRVMFTDYCMMDCHYCPNSSWVPRKRYGFKVDELARLFDHMHSRQMVDGLFLSSGIFKDPDHTQERLLNVVEAVRTRYKFKGYIHLKVMPGTSQDALLEAGQRLGTRLSINMESPSAEHLAKVSTMKQFDSGMVAPMRRINELMDQRYGGAVGQATQMVVGMSDETDLDLHRRARWLYDDMRFKRVYYSAFRPIKYTPLEERPATRRLREHRLYQLDWLTRVYRYTDQELAPAFDSAGFLETRADPKLAIAAQQFDRYPIDVNTAAESDLLRVPGIGPLAAQRIVLNRQRHSVTRRQELHAMGVVLKRALPFLRFPGHKPAPARQATMDLFNPEPAPHAERGAAARRLALHQTHAPSGCASCPLSTATCGMAPQGAVA